MTELATRGRSVHLIPLTEGRGSLVGPPDRVALALRHLHGTGRLVGASNAAPDGTGQVVVTVRLLPEQHDAPVAPAPSWWTRRRVTLAACLAAAAVGVIGTAAWIVLAWLAANAAVVAMALLAAAALAGGGGCVTVVRVFHRH